MAASWDAHPNSHTAHTYAQNRHSVHSCCRAEETEIETTNTLLQPVRVSLVFLCGCVDRERHPSLTGKNYVSNVCSPEMPRISTDVRTGRVSSSFLFLIYLYDIYGFVKLNKQFIYVSRFFLRKYIPLPCLCHYLNTALSRCGGLGWIMFMLRLQYIYNFGETNMSTW